MKFINPEILWGLLFLTVPILVHLFNFRKFKKVYFSNVDFLKEIKEETKSKSKLKHLLILLSRLLAIAALVFAFAQPYIPAANQDVKIGNKAVSLYIDNSFSMEGQDENGRLLDLAKNKAMEIVDIHNSTDKFQLLTNDFEGRHQRLVTKEEIINLIEEVKISPNTRKLTDVLSRQKDLLINSEEPNRESFIFSDLQKSSFDLADLSNDTLINVRIIPLLASIEGNKYIDSIWFSSPVRQLNQNEKLLIRIKNNSAEKVLNVPVKLDINGMQKALGSYAIESKSSIDSTLTFTNISSGIKSAVVELTDFPVVFDDKLYFSYEVAEQTNVLEIYGKNLNSKSIRSVFQDDVFFNYKKVSDNRIDYSDLVNFNLIILNQPQQVPSGLVSELEKFVANGGSIFIIPGQEITLSSYNDLLAKLQGNSLRPKVSSTTKVSTINVQHPLYYGVFDNIPNNIDLPKIKAHYPIDQITKNTGTTLMRLADGTPFLSYSKYKSGNVYLSSVSLSPLESNFTQHAIFVASLLRIAEFSQPSSVPYYTIGKDNVVLVKRIPVSEKSQIVIKKKEDGGGGVEFIPGYRHQGSQTEIFIQDQITDAGNYEIILDGSVIAGFSFNYPREESDLEAFSIAEIESTIEENHLTTFGVVTGNTDQLKNQVEELNEGKKLWLWLIIAALVFLIFEVILMKLK
ncbi:MAG TPA: hypothetical protein EYG86_07865 [Crocinitomicaceae bacterium]|nr:hypothetical protein [Crocinitomicaceae bacterium]